MKSRRKPSTKMRRRNTHIVRAMKCRYCWRMFHGRVSLYKKHIRNHEKKYRKHWSNRDGPAQKTDTACDETKMDQTIDMSMTKKEVNLSEAKSPSDSSQPVKERLYVYIVYAPPKSICECNKENRQTKMPCDCDYAYDRMVYASVAQMHRGLRDGISYDCKQCKRKVLPISLNDASKSQSAVCSKCSDSFSAQNDLEVHQQVCMGFKKTGQMFKCLQCSTGLQSHADMIRHATTVHADEDDADRIEENVCPVCDKRYSTSKHLKAHLQSHPEYAKKGYACSVCGWQCGNAGELMRHVRSHKENKTFIKTEPSTSRKRSSVKLRPHNSTVEYEPKSRYKKSMRKTQMGNKPELYEANSGSMRLRRRKQQNYDETVEADVDKSTAPQLRRKGQLNLSKSAVILNLQYKCKYCERAFASAAYLHHHNGMTHFGSEPYICLICKRRFSDKALFKLHREMHTETFKCTICRATFDSLELLHNHDQVHGVDERNCTECPAVFTDPKGFRQHLQRPSGEWDKNASQSKPNSYACKQCKKTFPSQQSLKVHEKLHIFDKRYPCNKCDESFPSQVLLRKHEKSHREDTKYPCKYCSKVFDFESDHKIHESLHEEYDGKAPEAHKYKCKYCRKGLQHLTDLKLHEALHEANGRKDFACDQCDKVFMYKLELQQHRRNHFRDKLPKPTKCDDCDKTFIWGKQLRDHRKTHWPEKPFLCVYCRTRYKTQEELAAHEPLHTKGKRHQCQICNRMFRDRRHIRDHMLIHTGEKPFPCRHCPKAFRQSSQRQTHERIHTREASFVCEVCNRGFIYWTSLRVHRRTHYKDKTPEEVEKLIKAPIMCKESKRLPRKGAKKTSSAKQTSGRSQVTSGRSQMIVEQQRPATNQDTTHPNRNQELQPGISSTASQNLYVHQNINVPVPLTIHSNEQMLQSLPEQLTSQLHQRPVVDEAQHNHPHLSSSSAAAGAPGQQEVQWEAIHNRYLSNPQTWQPPPNWQGLPGATSQPMQNPGNWDMAPGNWAAPPPAHQGHASASSIITSAMLGIMQRDNEGRVYQQ